MKKCHFCGEMIEDQMKVCPWCGRRQLNNTIEETKPKPDDFLESIVSKEKRESIGRDAKWTAIGIALLTLMGQQFFLNMDSIKTLYSPLGNYLKPGAASLGDYITIWNTFAVSAPLVLALSVIYVYAAERLHKGEGFAAGHYGVGALLLWLAALFGNAVGFTPVKTEGLRGGTPFAWMGLVLGDYLNSYGLVLFVSSVFVAIFMGRAWKKLAGD